MVDIVSVGGIATDLILRSPALPGDGMCVTATAFHHGLGGKAANQAVAAARLGGSVALVGCVGQDDAGRSAVARLLGEGVAVEHVTADPGVGTGAVVLHRTEGGEKRVLVFPGANGRLLPEAIDRAAPLLRAARVVLVQLEIPLATVQRVIETIRDSGARLVLDVSPIRTLPPEIVRAAAVIKANAAEASALLGMRVCDAPSARAAAARLLEAGAELVAIEAGGEGNLIASPSEEVFLPLWDIPAGDQTDPTGAGDAMVGGLAVAITEGRPLRDAARFACAAAALATRAPGAQAAMPARAELEQWLAANAGH